LAYAAIALAIVAAAAALGVEVEPREPKVYDLISLKYEPGSYIEVQSVRNGQLYFPPVREISESELLWTGPPGAYWVTGREGSRRIRVQVVVRGEGPTPDPQPDDDEDEDDPTPEPEPDEIEDTPYGVGSQMRAIISRDKRNGVADVFALAARTAKRRGGVVQEYAEQIVTKLRPTLTEQELQAYGELFALQNRAGVIVTMDQHIGAWEEVATWLRK
jgi:hypothetical protein